MNELTILGTTFYICHNKGKVYLGIVIPPLGVVYEELDVKDYEKWLR